jgi:hypothetical protein
MDVTVNVIRGEQSLGQVPIVACSVDATLLTQDGRTASLVVDQGVIDDGLLDPLSDTVVIRTGVSDVELVPIFTGRVDAHAAGSDGDVTVACVSRAVELTRARFETPMSARPGALIRDEIQRLVQDVDPAWSVDVSVARPDRVPDSLLWEEDRSGAVDELATSLNCILMPNRVGGFILVPSRFAEGANVTPVATLRDGENGVLVKIDSVKSRRDIANSVTVVVERTDGTSPIRITVRDTNPASPTFWGGVFGKQNVVLKLDSPSSTLEASVIASRVLRQSLAVARTWRITLPHYPVLDPGDVIVIWHRGEPFTQVIESVRYSGGASEPTVLAARELIVAPTP